MIKIGAVIVTYKSEKDLAKCIESFVTQKIPNAQFVTCVVDNASGDKSVAIAKKRATYTIENETNVGFSKAVNRGLRKLIGASCDYFLILNPDALLRQNAISNLIKVLDENEMVAAVGPRMVNNDGSDANSGYYLKAPSILTVGFFSTFLRPWALKRPGLTRRYEEKLGDKVQSVEQIPGAAIFTDRRRIEDVGLLCEEFPIWFEDVEWCYRARRKGYSLLFVPDALFVHEGGVSFAKWNDLNKAVTFYVSMKTFFRLHKPLSLPVICCLVVLNAFFVFLKNRDKSQLVFVRRFLTQKRGTLPT